MKTISKEDAKDVLDNAMSDPCPANWDKANKVFGALYEMFPTRVKTVDRLVMWAGNASQEVEEPCLGEKHYERMWWNVMNAVERLGFEVLRAHGDEG